MIEVYYRNGNLYVRTDYNEINVQKAREIPQRRWLPKEKVWSCRPSLANFNYLKLTWPEAVWSDAAEAARLDCLEREETRERVVQFKARGVDPSDLEGVEFKMPPMEHQKKALLLARDQVNFAYLMEQGTGKTKCVIDDAAHNWRSDRIDALLVICPNSVKSNWVSWEGVDAIHEHMPDDVPVIKGIWASKRTSGENKKWGAFLKGTLEESRGKLIVLVINYEAALVPKLYTFLENFCSQFRTMIVCDESTRIKHPGAKRTKLIHKLRKSCVMSRIMTGTPVIQALENAYSQFSFMDEDILGFSSFYSFKNHFCVMGGFEGRQILSYKNVDELSERISRCSFRVLKNDCMDLPQKIYQKRSVEMTREQLKLYNDMRKEMVIELDGVEVDATIALTQLLRLQQITGGYLTKDDQFISIFDDPEKNPKIIETMNIIEEAGDQQVIVWARFKAEINNILACLQRRGITCAKFDGDVPPQAREDIIKDFQAGKIKVLVANQSAGGIGLNLFAASVAIYYSNSFNTEDRVQSEDRCHRKGSERHSSVSYYDIIVPGTVDTKIVSALRSNKRISDEIMKDGILEWI